jgi:hypothetical protein
MVGRIIRLRVSAAVSQEYPVLSGKRPRTRGTRKITETNP